MSFELDLREHPGPGGPLRWARVPWDSDALGMEIVELRCEGEPDAVATALGSLLGRLDADGPHLAFARLAVGDVARAQALAAAGFHPVETSFELSLPLARRANAAAVRFPGGLVLRPALEADRDAVVAIARTAFGDDRYHLDPAVPDERADERFAVWVQRAFAAGEPVFVLAGEDGRVIGFFHVREDGADVDLSLAAVHADVRRAGLGPLLYAAMLDECRARGHRAAHTRIAAQNLDVLNVYVHLGFQFLRAWLCLHRVGGRRSA